MDKKIGFIGCGNMGKAILGGLIASGQVLPGQIWVYTPSPDKVAALRDEYGVNAAESAQDVAQVADIVFGAVKPNIMIKVLSEITSSLNKETLVVSIAAGVTLDQLARALGHDRKIVPPGRRREPVCPGVCLYVYRSHGRCRRTGWNAARAGLQICSAGGDGFGQNGAGNG